METSTDLSPAPLTRTHKPTTPRWLRRLLEFIPIYVVLVPLAVITLLPLVYMFSQALTPESDVYNWPVRYLPENPTFENFIRLWEFPNLPIVRWLINSFFVSTMVTILILFIDSLTAYGFARLEFPGRNVLFVLILLTIMIPGQVTLIPTFLIMRDLGWLDTYNALDLA